MTYRVRRAWKYEIGECADLYCQFFPGIGRPSAETIWWVAVHGDEIAGFASVKRYAGKSHPDALFMSSAGVLAGHRGHGLHKRLIRARVRWAKRKGITRVFTYTMPDNAHSIASLVACGFRIFVPEVPWFEDCAHCHHDGALYWEKFLT
jgi:GNAT superfamily N-acetyltransferase